MPRFPILCFLSLSVIGSLPTYAQDPPKPVPPAKTPEEANSLKPEQRFQHLPLPPGWPKPEDLKPSPPFVIPDDPPPHEGAMIDYPVIIEPTDIVNIEVLEGLPGRPITGDNLVWPDGSVTLGFYGDVHLRGLTPRQAKMKIIFHLQRHLRDEVLGLVITNEPDQDFDGMTDEEKLPVPPSRNPFELELRPKGSELPEIVPPELFKKPMESPKLLEIPDAMKGASARRSRVLIRSTDEPIGDQATKNRRAKRRIARSSPRNDLIEQDPESPFLNVVLASRPGDGGFRVITPADSNRVFVEIRTFNSKNYYVQGHVGKPGRLPFTGHDTVLDALNYAGGLLPSADPQDIHVYRPARGGKPRTVLPIDYAAILKGEASANLQLFPNDRLVIGSKPDPRQQVDQD